MPIVAVPNAVYFVDEPGNITQIFVTSSTGVPYTLAASGPSSQDLAVLDGRLDGLESIDFNLAAVMSAPALSKDAELKSIRHPVVAVGAEEVVYTCPVGKTAIVYAYGVFNKTAGSIIYRTLFKKNGVSRALTPLLTLISSANSSVLGGLILQAGEQILATQNAAGLVVVVGVSEFPSTQVSAKMIYEPVNHLRSVAYECPVGKRAIVVDYASTFTAHNFTPSFVIVNYGPAIVTGAYYVLAEVGEDFSTVLPITFFAGGMSANGGGYTRAIVPILHPGDRIGGYTTAVNPPDVYLRGAVIEIDIPT